MQVKIFFNRSVNDYSSMSVQPLSVFSIDENWLDEGDLHKL